jgi:hypothetical protein
MGLQREYLHPPVLSYAQAFPELSRYRELARLVNLEAELALRAGRGGDAVQSGLDIIKMGNQIRHGGSLIHSLTGVGVGTIGLQSLENSISAADAATSLRAAKVLWSLDSTAPPLVDSLTAERDGNLVCLAELCRSSPAQIAHALGSSEKPPRWEDWDAIAQTAVTPRKTILSNYRSYMDAEIARVRKPYSARGAPTPLPSDPVTSRYGSLMDEIALTWARGEALRRILATRLAVRAYSLQEGHPPASLAALTPKYLPAVPQDPFAPAPLVYRVTNGQPVLYSCGPDGDDDGGQDLGSSLVQSQESDVEERDGGQ